MKAKGEMLRKIRFKQTFLNKREIAQKYSHKNFYGCESLFTKWLDYRYLQSEIGYAHRKLALEWFYGYEFSKPFFNYFIYQTLREFEEFIKSHNEIIYL